MGIQYLTDRLLGKAEEAFVMAIEIYNKPTIRYRLEGFSFFICNAWELMLKSYIIKRYGETAIYYKDNPSRTISLENCIEKIFTNEKAPLRMNLEKIIELRNTSTHFITEDYEMVYVPLLQACIFNFVDKMKEFHDVDITEIIPENFITLPIRINALNESEIRAKYTHPVSEKLINLSRNLRSLIEDNNSSFAIRVEHQYYLTKKREDASDTFHISQDAEEGARIIKDLKDPNDTYKYNAKACIREINKQITRQKISLMYSGKVISEINKYHFQLFVDYYGIKNNPRLCYVYKIPTQPQYSYSMQLIELIVGEIKKKPATILDTLKARLKKKLTPGAKDSKR